MIKITSPDQYTTIPWKNGLGQTTELALSPNGNLADFDWRLSIASVTDDGAFSDFTGYQRQLLLLKGNGIELTHNNHHVDKLIEPLSIADFDGANSTYAQLIDGPIEDFNVMVKQGKYTADVNTYAHQQSVKYQSTTISFVYASRATVLCQTTKQKFKLAANHLLQIINETPQKIEISGTCFIVINVTTEVGT